MLWAGAGGLADLDDGIPVTTETRFDMASVSKQFTATAILMLQREGCSRSATRSARYVDGLPAWGSTVTLDQLMHHTSRIPDYWVELDKIHIGFSDPADQADDRAGDPAREETRAGHGFLYSNSNYVLLAEVVARVSGRPLPEFLDERIFTPLGLDMVLAPTLHAPDIALSYDDNSKLQEAGWTSYGHTGIITTPPNWRAGATSTARATSSKTTSRSARSTRPRVSCTRPEWTSRSTATSTTPGAWADSSPTSRSPPTASGRSRSCATGTCRIVSRSPQRCWEIWDRRDQAGD